MAASLYIHIPFCQSKCRYCSFSSYAGLQELFSRYVSAVKSELRQLADSARHNRLVTLETVFFGGGTPTVLPAEALADILRLSLSLFPCSPGAEISIEANPGTIDSKNLALLRQGGFNRLSIGIQSLSAAELTMLGRCHTPHEAIEGFAQARKAGFTNISLDLMYGLCGQTLDSWRQTLESALALRPDHLSLYQLTIEEGTPVADMVEWGELHLPDEEVILAMDEMNIRKCGRAGLALYEVSNFARDGCKCRHNINYWRNDEYLAAGAGAVSYLQGERQRRVSDPEEYCRRLEHGHTAIIDSETLEPEASFRESVIMGLRMTEGIALNRLRERYGIDPAEYYGKTLDKLIAQRLVELTPSHLRVTAEGRVFSNFILAELV